MRVGNESSQRIAGLPLDRHSLADQRERREVVNDLVEILGRKEPADR